MAVPSPVEYIGLMPSCPGNTLRVFKANQPGTPSSFANVSLVSATATLFRKLKEYTTDVAA